jgi:hypothetical protein
MICYKVVDLAGPGVRRPKAIVASQAYQFRPVIRREQRMTVSVLDHVMIVVAATIDARTARHRDEHESRV